MLFTPATYVNTQDVFERLVDELLGESLVAIDTESNSLHAYQDQVCLVQISTRTNDYIVDPLAVDIQSLGVVLASPEIEKVFHAAEYDIMTMKRDFGFEFRNLFDTMVAARICGFRQVGLASILETYAAVELDKSHQLDDWHQRPLPAESLRYAQQDTHYLPLLRDEFQEYMVTHGHLDEAHEIFAEVCLAPPAKKREFDPDGFWKTGIPNHLKDHEMRVLRELFALREKLAHAENRPPYKVLGNMTLVRLSRAMPASRSAVRKIQGIRSEYIKDILAAIKRGQTATELPPPPHNEPPDPVITDRYAALHAWRKARAMERGVESDVIISKQTLWHVANEVPQSLEDLSSIRGMGPWRIATYGPEILSVLDDMGVLER